MTRSDEPHEPRELLGEDLWELLGHASEVPADAMPDRPPTPVPIPQPWRGLAAALLAALVPFLVIPSVRRSRLPPPVLLPEESDDLALVRDLELAENIDLVGHPDFEVLMRWDGGPL